MLVSYNTFKLLSFTWLYLVLPGNVAEYCDKHCLKMMTDYD